MDTEQANVNRAVQQQLQRQQLEIENLQQRLHNTELVLMAFASILRDTLPLPCVQPVQELFSAWREQCKVLGHDFDQPAGNRMQGGESDDSAPG